MKLFGYTLPELRKAIVAFTGILASLLAANLLPNAWDHYVSVAIGILTVIGTYSIGNADPPAAQPLGRHEAP